LPELNHLEIQFLILNDFSLMIHPDEMQFYADHLLRYWIMEQQRLAEKQQLQQLQQQQLHQQQYANPSTPSYPDYRQSPTTPITPMHFYPPNSTQLAVSSSTTVYPQSPQQMEDITPHPSQKSAEESQ
jgi:hypothetical protein